MTDKSAPAFPIFGETQEFGPVYESGLTKREYIAVEAMKALIIGRSAWFVPGNVTQPDWRTKMKVAAYAMADTMLEDE